MSLLWTSEAMIEAMNGRPVGALPEGITGISIDTRTLRKGEAFFAIKGDALDGHDFATAAVAAGAALLVVAEVKLPALGFGMGDVVLEKVIEAVPAAKAQMDAWCELQRACEVFVVVAKEESRAQALAVVQQLRDAGRRVDFALTEAKVGKQFQAAEALGAKWAVVVGEEWPLVKVKALATREEKLVEGSAIAAALG